MKPIRDIEATRRAHWANAERDTVHRSSLLVPTIAGCEAEIGFLNHFLLKRGHREVACRLTAVDPQGRKIASRTHRIHEPRVPSQLAECGGAGTGCGW